MPQIICALDIDCTLVYNEDYADDIWRLFSDLRKLYPDLEPDAFALLTHRTAYFADHMREQIQKKGEAFVYALEVRNKLQELGYFGAYMGTYTAESVAHEVEHDFYLHREHTYAYVPSDFWLEGIVTPFIENFEVIRYTIMDDFPGILDDKNHHLKKLISNVATTKNSDEPVTIIFCDDKLDILEAVQALNPDFEIPVEVTLALIHVDHECEPCCEKVGHVILKPDKTKEVVWHGKAQAQEEDTSSMVSLDSMDIAAEEMMRQLGL